MLFMLIFLLSYILLSLKRCFFFCLKINSKFDQNTDLAAQCLEWMHHVINSGLGVDELPVEFDTSGDSKNFSSTLHNGVILAR